MHLTLDVRTYVRGDLVLDNRSTNNDADDTINTRYPAIFMAIIRIGYIRVQGIFVG